MKTLKELTNIYGLSRVTFLKRMNKIANFRKKYTKRSKGKIFINNEGVKLINEPRHNSTSNQFHTRHGSSPNQLNRAELIKLWKQARNDSRKKIKLLVDYQSLLNHFPSNNITIKHKL